MIAADRGVERVACACEVAAAAGVRQGMTVAHARSLLAGRRVRAAPHKPEEVARALDRMVQWAFRFSPVVTADYPDGLLLDISGCSHLYAGEERLAKSIVWELEQWRFPARVCVGPTVAVARAVARYSAERITVIPDHAAGDELRFLPVSALGVEPDIRDALAEIGVVNIDQLLNLPREDLAPRFGAALLSRVDRALGLAHELIEPVKCLEPVEFKRLFEGAITNQEAIFLAVEQLVREMISRLASQESGVCRMTLKFHRIDDRRHGATKPRSHEETRHEGTEARRHEEITKLPNCQITKSHPDVSLSLSFPSRDFKHLWALLRPRLERVQLGYGIEEIVLHVLQMQRLSPTQMELWLDAASATHVDDHVVMGQWLDQVIERLGRHAVVEMKPVERYLPEETFAAADVELKARRHEEKVIRQRGNEAKPALTPTLSPGERGDEKTNSKFEIRNSKSGVYPAERPSKLFLPPQHARVIALVPDGPPAWIQWDGQEEHVVRGYGPERICGPWWGRDSHEATKPRSHDENTRDYFVIHTDAGLWLWVYRDCPTGNWYVHGEWE